MATGLTLRLSSRQALRAVEDVDLLELLAGALTGRDAGTRSIEPSRPNGAVAEPGQAAAWDPESGGRVLLPAQTLRMIRMAGLAALAARELAAPGVLTAAVFGSGTVLRLQVEVLARYLPALSHVALAGPVFDPLAPLAGSALDQLDLAGIGVSTAAEPRRAALGANLFVVTAAGPDARAIGRPPRGALLVNASGQDLPREAIEAVDRVCVDDLRLLGRYQDRTFARTHMAGPDTEPRPFLPHREGWYRHPDAGRRWQRVEADLRGVLARTSQGRTDDDDDIVLAELLGTGAADAALAWQLRQAAAEQGLGDWIDPA